MNYYVQLTRILIVSFLLFCSCKKKNDFITPGSSAGAGPESEIPIDEIRIPDNFNFKTTQNVNTSLTFGPEMANTLLKFYDYTDDTKGVLLFSAATNSNGYINVTYDVPNHVNKIIAFNSVIGIPNETIFEVNYGELIKTNQPFIEKGTRRKSGSLSFTYHDTYNADGVPDNLVTPNDVIDDALLSVVSNSLPESSPVPTNNPQYIADGVESDVGLSGLADVWITFVHEGAGFRNALAFYTYDLSTPPATSADITNLSVILPNASFVNSRGGLLAGNKVYLGQFPANTGIGWVLIANGWNGTSVGNGLGVYYSNPDFNPESSASNRNHNVILNDDVRDILLIGFEDINREASNCDNDFNDLIFYVTANPYSSIITDDYEEVTQSTISDFDNDGFSDANDAYPSDPNKVADVYYPGENILGTLLYEDLWPGIGDYDFNDLVMCYNYHFVTNASNEAVELNASFTMKAIGASYRNGFAFTLNTAPGNISSVSGQENFNSLYTLSGGIEEQGSKSVIPVTDNNWKYMSRSGTSGFANTVQSESKVDDQTFNVSVIFNSPVSVSNLGGSPFDPFITIDQNRGKEVHLPGYEPTSLADNNFFQTFHDDTKLNEDKYYLTRTNLPWALHIPYDFKYCREKESISESYYYFNGWATSGGLSETDWYLDNSSKRNASKVFDK